MPGFFGNIPRWVNGIEGLLQGILNASLFTDMPKDDVVLAAEELRQAANSIGRITGRVDVEDVLDVLFSQFCIGK